MSFLRKLLFLTLVITTCLKLPCTCVQFGDKNNKTIKHKRPKFKLDHGGFSWARPYNYEKEDMEIGVHGRQFKRLLEVSSFDMLRLIELRASDRKLMPKDIEKIEAGTGRDPQTCENPDQEGGAAAKLGTVCDVALWTKHRQEFLQSIITTTFDVEILKRHPTDVELSFNVFLIEQLEYFEQLKQLQENRTDDTIETGFFNFFKSLCISCTGDPLLMCDRTSGNNGTCKCWNYYITQKVNGQDECRIEVGKRCHHVYGARCVVNAFCDQKYICQCMTRRKCAGVKGQMDHGQWYIVIVMGFLQFGLQRVVQFNV